ncbi:Arginyl-tRNA--protein transferase [hydrothermal vent metagenome]|uniref:Arginyl-tRNA--protein transferase n=1 Tax=hydrothermal vent metagenome TaxID=652676 RepID=A0A3B1AIT7_9ZZZZ
MNDETSKYHQLHDYRFFVTPEHECSYLPNRQATTLFIDPQADLTTETYSLFSELGFRRGGDHVYRPHCTLCHECKSVRINVNKFTPSRSQRRISKKNMNTTVHWIEATYKQEHFELYQLYMNHRHGDSSMVSDDSEQYQRMMNAPWCKTKLAEFYDNDKLIAVAITDWLGNGLSAVYTFFDPDYSEYSLGTFSILQQVTAAKKSERDYVYLGYWIKDCDKMSYKNKFAPIEVFNGHSWQIHS